MITFQLAVTVAKALLPFCMVNTADCCGPQQPPVVFLQSMLMQLPQQLLQQLPGSANAAALAASAAAARYVAATRPPGPSPNPSSLRDSNATATEADTAAAVAASAAAARFAAATTPGTSPAFTTGLPPPGSSSPAAGLSPSSSSRTAPGTPGAPPSSSASPAAASGTAQSPGNVSPATSASLPASPALVTTSPGTAPTASTAASPLLPPVSSNTSATPAAGVASGSNATSPAASPSPIPSPASSSPIPDRSPTSAARQLPSPAAGSPSPAAQPSPLAIPSPSSSPVATDSNSTAAARLASPTLSPSPAGTNDTAGAAAAAAAALTAARLAGNTSSPGVSPTPTPTVGASPGVTPTPTPTVGASPGVSPAPTPTPRASPGLSPQSPPASPGTTPTSSPLVSPRASPSTAVSPSPAGANATAEGASAVPFANVTSPLPAATPAATPASTAAAGLPNANATSPPADTAATAAQAPSPDSGCPPGIPTTGAQYLVYVKGINYLLNATYFNQSKTEGFKNTLSNLTGVPACWINITNVTPYNLNPNGSLGSPSTRRLLQAPTALTLDLGVPGTAPWQRRRLAQAGTGVGSDIGAALGIDSFLPSTDGNGVLNALNEAYSNNRLADGILPDPLQLELLRITPTGYNQLAVGTSGGSSSNLGLKIGLPVAIGCVLALLLCCCCVFGCLGWRKRQKRQRQQTELQQNLASHKVNPFFDTTGNLTTTSSSRGDDFEVIRVPPGQPLPIQETLFPDATGYMPPEFTPAQMRSGGSGSSVMTDTDYAEAYTYSMGVPRQGVGGLAPGAGPSLTSYPIIPRSQHPNPFIGPIGDTDSSSDFEAIPTPGGLRFQDTPSPSGSEFNTPPTSLVDRPASITDDEEDAQFGTPSASLAGSFRSGLQGSIHFPVQLHGPVFQEPSLYNSSAMGGYSSAMGGGGSQQYELPDLRAGFTYPDMPQPGPMPAGHGPIRTLAGPQGPQGPQDAFAPFAGLSLSSTDSSPEQSGAAAGYEGYPHHPYLPQQHLPYDPQGIPMGFSSSSGDQSFEEAPSYSLGPYGQPQLQGSHTPYQDPASSSPDYIPPVGEMTHAPSSHFVSSGSFDFGGGLNEGLGELDTAGLLPNLGSQPLEMTELELESSPGSETLASPREYGHYPAAATHGPTGPAGPDTGPTVNPMFGTDILDTQGSDVGQAQRRNPVWESHSRLEPQGGAPNPLYGSAADILASRDSLGAMRNPVWESHSAEAPVGSSNPLFGTGVLDTTDSINGGNPLYESNRRRQDGQE